MVFHQFIPFVALTRLLGICFRLQRLRLARLTGELLLEALRVRRQTDGV